MFKHLNVLKEDCSKFSKCTEVCVCVCVLLTCFRSLFFSLQNLEMQHGSLLALGFTVGRYLSKRKMKIVELHGIEDRNTILAPEQDQLIKSTTETIGQSAYLHFPCVLVPFCSRWF